MKNIRFIALAALLMLGATMQAQVAGEFYSFVGWEDNSGGSGIRSVAHYTEHGKKVELPYSYLIDDPEAMGIGNDFITDATPVQKHGLRPHLGSHRRPVRLLR